MPNQRISFYYKNVMSEVIGDEHGISQAQMDELAAATSPMVGRLNAERQQGGVKYRDLPWNEEMLAKVAAMADDFRPGCENLVVLGIGGSALGNIALQTALNPYMYNLDERQRKGPRLFVFDNVDPDQFGSFMAWIRPQLDKTVFNVISKSGRTAETAAQFLIVREELIRQFGMKGYRQRVVATTDPAEGTLRNIADAEGLRTLEVPPGVGGRWSVLSAVGLFSAAMTGVDVESLAAGARDMDERLRSEEFYQNPAAINAAVNWHYYNRGKRISVMMPYSHALKDFADWYRQLWAESLGKKKDLDGKDVYAGPTPVKALGATDQHSQVQLYREGPNDKLFTFLEVGEFRHAVTCGEAPPCAPELGYLAGRRMCDLLGSEKAGTEYALIKSNRPCLSVIFPRVNAYTVGQFICFYEVTTSLMGLLLNIDAYDQPAVELGKEATFALMGLEKYGKLAEEIKPFVKRDEEYMV